MVSTHPLTPSAQGGGISRIATYNGGGNYIVPTCIVILRFCRNRNIPT
ncbi:hypothetical protein [Helicobacter macacae]|nr:hypothetical protein [Helicobacter macacae]